MNKKCAAILMAVMTTAVVLCGCGTYQPEYEAKENAVPYTTLPEEGTDSLYEVQSILAKPSYGFCLPSYIYAWKDPKTQKEYLVFISGASAGGIYVVQR